MDLIKEIEILKKEKNALILAHFYQREEIQAIADYVGDSYYLSKIAKDSPNNLIIFCGVKFMAESAKILSPEKTILLPALDAGCPMAEMANEEGLLELKKQHPDAATVCYINSTSEVKALCDVTVTSSNAIKVVNKLPQDKIIFLPDKNLGAYLQQQLPNKEFILWPGFCITHKKISKENISKSKEAINDLKVLVHPECEKEVRDLADFIGSTGEIIDFASNSPFKNYLIATEEGILYKLKKDNPDKNFYFPGTSTLCPNMKKTRLIDVYNALKDNTYEITLDEELRLKALNCLIKMHEMAR